MIAIVISLLFGLAAFASLMVIRHSVEQAVSAQRAIRAELAEMDSAVVRQRRLARGAGPVLTRRAAWSRPVVQPVKWALTPCVAA